jgi:anti-sigma factor ChrR (cupin superfamily)
MNSPAHQISQKDIAERKDELGARESTAGGSVYVKPQEMEWAASQFEGIDMKILYQDVERGEMTVLLRWKPGATLPFHKHPEIEQSWVLEGSFYDHDGICRAGEFVWRRPQSKHETKTDEGCTILAIYRKPNIFAKGAGFKSKAGAGS